MSWTGSTIDGNAYTKRKKLTYSKTYVDATQTNITIKYQFVDDADIGTAGGSSTMLDLRFTLSDATTLLYAERESGTIASGKANGIFWVKVSSLSTSTNTDIYVYFGNATAGAQATPTSAWDTNHSIVLHLNETGTNPTAYDSTVNANNTSAQAWTPTTGLMGGGGSFNGSSQYLRVANKASLNPTTAITLSCWIKPTDITTARYIELMRQDSSGNRKLFAFQEYGTQLTLGLNTGSYWETDFTITPTCFTDGNWHHVAYVYDGAHAILYVDGAQNNSVAKTGAIHTETADLYIANYASEYYYGLMDEVKFVVTNRLAEWIKVEYYNQKDATGQVTIGALETAVTTARRRLIIA